MLYFIALVPCCIDGTFIFFGKIYAANTFKPLKSLFSTYSKRIIRWIFIYVVKDKGRMNLS
ncbi:hypothetical protein A9Z50_09665 [Aeromonas hydrophila]|nr:hypothetical protein [Aeromonas hydrophila]